MCAKKVWHFSATMRSVIAMFPLHDGMQAEVTVDGHMTPEFDVCNGLRHIAPNLYAAGTAVLT